MKPGNTDKIPEFEILLNYSEVSLVIPLINRSFYLFFAAAVAMSRSRIVLARPFPGNTSAYCHVCSGCALGRVLQGGTEAGCGEQEKQAALAVVCCPYCVLFPFSAQALK